MLVVGLSCGFFIINCPFFVINNLLSQLSTSHMCMGLGPSTRPWKMYQKSCLQRKVTLLPSPIINCCISSVKGRDWGAIPHPQHNFDSLDLIQLCAGRYSCCELRHVVAITCTEVSVSSSSISLYIISAHSSVMFLVLEEVVMDDSFTAEHSQFLPVGCLTTQESLP